jgi:hypothetical protein
MLRRLRTGYCTYKCIFYSDELTRAWCSLFHWERNINASFIGTKFNWATTTAYSKSVAGFKLCDLQNVPWKYTKAQALLFNVKLSLQWDDFTQGYSYCSTGIRHLKVLGLSAKPTGRLYPQEISLVLFSVKNLSPPQGHSTAETFQDKNPWDAIGNRMCHRPSLCTMPQPTAPP